MYRFLLLITFLTAALVLLGQEKSSNIASEGLSCKSTSQEYTNYYNRYDFYKDHFNKLNEVVIPFNFCIWLKDDGTGNYQNTPENDEMFKQIEHYIERFYIYNTAKSDTIPDVTDLPSTKIHFQLRNIFYIRNTSFWEYGNSIANADGLELNKEIRHLYPSEGNYFNIHVTGANPQHNGASGYTVIPGTILRKEHFIITFNRNRLHILEEDRTYPIAIHLIHELAHNFDLTHNYDNAICDQNNPDYLDDVFGKGENAVCPHEAGWSCNSLSADNSCTNNIMGGTSGGAYFSPKQIYRMHRALALKSIRNYAYNYSFSERNTIDITKNETWDFNMKLYNSLRILSGCTLTVRCQINFVEKASLQLEERAVLIVDGGSITNDQPQSSGWKGIAIKRPKRKSGDPGKVFLKNGGHIDNELKADKKMKYYLTD